MKPWQAVLLFLVLLLIVATALFKVGQQYPEVSATPPSPAPVQPITPSESKTATEPAPEVAPESKPQQMVFSRTGLNARIIDEVERVCGANNSKVAALETPHGRRVCVIVAGERRYYSLDQGLLPSHFPLLQRMAFAMAPPPMEKTLSIYRSVTKSAIHYNPAAGDRIVVLTCDRGGMETMKLEWPAEE